MTLGCLAPYRRLGIGKELWTSRRLWSTPWGTFCFINFAFVDFVSPGTKMLNHVLNICEKDGTFDNIYLWVTQRRRCIMRGPWGCILEQLFKLFYHSLRISYPSPQSRADQQRVSHSLLPEVWLWDHWNKKELLQEDRARRCPCVAEEPAQPMCTAQRRASEGRVGARCLERAQLCQPPQKQNCDKRPKGRHNSTLSSKDAKREKQI